MNGFVRAARRFNKSASFQFVTFIWIGVAVDWLFAVIFSAVLLLFFYAVFLWMEAADEDAWPGEEDSFA